jgi:hypothetical protein
MKTKPKHIARNVDNKLKKIGFQLKMNDTEKIKQAITDFVKAGDNSDVQLLDNVLHKDFRVTNNGFMGTPGVAIIDKNEYLNNIKSGVFGGLPRKMQIEQLDQSGKIASVKLRIESAENDFLSYNSLVLDTDGQWKIINNLAVVNPKNTNHPSNSEKFEENSH